jgi:predicted dehydrogenase
VELVGLSDLSQERLDRFTGLYGAPGFTEYREMLRLTKPDLVTIATHAGERPGIIAEVAKHAGMIYAEKPLANTFAECQKALACGAKVAYGVNRRYHETYRYAKRMVDEGEIGEVLDVTAEFGRGQLMWTHTHSVDLFLMFLGKGIKGVYADLEDGPDPVIRHAVFDFESGARATITRAGGCNLRIAGTEGTLTVVGDGEAIHLDIGSGYHVHEEIRVQPRTGATVTALTELIAGKVVPRDEVLLGIEMLEECKRSSARKERVCV